MKSTVEQIRQRFDQDVERFSNLETGQSATVDSPLCMELIASACVAVTPGAKDLLDIGCGAGNYTLKILEKYQAAAGSAGASMPAVNCQLLDLSRPMLDRAVERVSAKTAGVVRAHQADMRELPLAEGSLDLVVAASTLHHLRADEEWEELFRKIFRALRPGGSFWIFDLIEQTHPAIEGLMKERYGAYLESLKGGGEAGRRYREHVFAYIEQEDTPKPVLYQTGLLERVGFGWVDILHKNSVNAAFGGQKPGRR